MDSPIGQFRAGEAASARAKAEYGNYYVHNRKNFTSDETNIECGEQELELDKEKSPSQKRFIMMEINIKWYITLAALFVPEVINIVNTLLAWLCWLIFVPWVFASDGFCLTLQSKK